jgi:hypothetical protein
VSLLLHYYGKTSKRSKKKLKKSSKSLEKSLEKAVPKSWPQDPYHFVVTGIRLNTGQHEH